GQVVLLDKSSFCGGNSTKATSGINGAETKTQKAKGIDDTITLFTNDTLKGGAKKPELVKVLCGNSGADVDWLVEKFNLDLSLVARLGGHSAPRTHRGAERFPGMTITYALIQMVEKVAERSDKARIITKAKVTKLLTANGGCVGCTYEKGGQSFSEMGPVILATGGFGADFTSNSLLAQYRPDLMHLPTTNGEHCTGDGIKMGEAIGAKSIDLEWVQVHPTGLVKPDDPDAKIKFLAAEALRGVGGLVLDAAGNRFANELGRRDYVTGEMWKNKPPFRLCLNKAASAEGRAACVALQALHWPRRHEVLRERRGARQGHGRPPLRAGEDAQRPLRGRQEDREGPPPCAARRWRRPGEWEGGGADRAPVRRRSSGGRSCSAMSPWASSTAPFEAGIHSRGRGRGCGY
ncbi:unnamed protein product, partial [Prorocentrum cordatum]